MIYSSMEEIMRDDDATSVEGKGLEGGDSRPAQYGGDLLLLHDD